MNARILLCVVILAIACDRADPGPPSATAVSPEGAQHFDFAYSHDGSRLAYWALSTGSDPVYELWVANGDMSAPVKLPMIAPISLPYIRALWSPDDSLIAAGTSQWGGFAVAVAPSTGGEARRLSFGTGIENPVSWESGTELLDYRSNVGEKYYGFVVSVRTGVSERTIPGETRSHRSYTAPGGKHIAFELTEGDRRTIWVADSGGRNPRPLTTEGFESFGFGYEPWSPDGLSIVYESVRTGMQDLWVVLADGSRHIQLTRDIRSDNTPSWSPDGKWIAFWSDRGRQNDLWLVPAEGGVERPITRDGRYPGRPKWRPGSNQVAYIDFETKSGIWLLDVASGTEQQLTPDSIHMADELALARDGTMVAYTFDRGGSIHDLFVQPVNGGVPRHLFGGDGIYSPTFSPNGKQVAFGSDRGGTLDIWIVDVAGGPARRLTDWPGNERGPVWTDTSFLWFTSNRESVDRDVWRIPAAGGTPERVTTSGGINGLITRFGVPALFANVRLQSGRRSLVLVRPDGSFQTVWDSSGSFLASISPTGDSITAVVQMPDGTQESRVIAVQTGRGRRILQSGEYAGGWSNDGKSLVYAFRTGGVSHLGLLTLATGATRPLASNVNEASYLTFWTPDDRTIVFGRSESVSRIHTVDVSSALKGSMP